MESDPYFFPAFLKRLPPAKPEISIGIKSVGKPVDGIDLAFEVVVFCLYTLLSLVPSPLNETGFDVGVGVGVADLKNPKKPPLFFCAGVGVKVVFAAVVDVLLFKLILPVTTAKKTRTTTRPKANEITLLKLSI